MVSDSASNWVDRGEPPELKIVKALRHFLGFGFAPAEAELEEQARVLVSMVAADASEVQVAAYLGHLEDEAGRPRVTAAHRRLEAIAIWHIAKAALTRDAAIRGRTEAIGGDLGAPPSLSAWLAERILRGDPE